MKCWSDYRKLAEYFRPFGRETILLEYLHNELEKYADECFVDTYGSLIVHQKGPGKRVMISAQADVPTVLITYIETDRTGRFLMTGKGNCKIEEGSRICFGDHSFGTVVFDSNCAGESDLQRMRIKPEGAALHVGDKGILSGDLCINDGKIEGPHSGIAVGCIALMELVKAGCRKDLDLYYVFSVGSEAELISQRGVMCAAFWIKPDVGISIETFAANSDQAVPCTGPVVMLKDEHAVLRRNMRDIILSSAQEVQIALQYAALDETSRETALYHYQCVGAGACTLAFAVKESATVKETASLDDCNQCIVVIKKLIEKV